MIEWNEDQEALRSGLRPMCEALSEGHIERDAEAAFPWDKWKLVAESGILGIPFEECWGGLGQDLVTTLCVLEELGYRCRDGGLSFSISSHIVSTGIAVQRFGSAGLKERYLRRLCEGTAIGAHAITEPDYGSDALSMTTRAERHHGLYVLNGTKTFVSNGPVADLITVYARTHPDGGPLGITAFLIERDTPGLSIGTPISKMGLRTSPVCELFFDDCQVPAAQVVGREGGGFLVLDYVMKWEILCSFIINTGEMRHRLQRCVEYAKTRRQFDQPIGDFQAISHKLVEMKIGVETSRKWLYDTAQKFSKGENVTVDIAISKLLTSEYNVASAAAAMQIFGGNGYMTEYGLEKDLRNAVASTIYSGTSEIQRNRVAKMMT